MKHTDFSATLFREIQAHYGFVGGTEEEYAAYFNREDIDDTLWTFALPEEVRAVAGFSCVAKKDKSKQRKLLMACAQNYAFCRGKDSEDHGMFGD